MVEVGNGKSVVAVRSVSRVGVTDLGFDANHIFTVLADLTDRPFEASLHPPNTHIWGVGLKVEQTCFQSLEIHYPDSVFAYHVSCTLAWIENQAIWRLLYSMQMGVTVQSQIN